MKNPEREIPLEEMLPPEVAKWYRQCPRFYSPNGEYLGRSLAEKNPNLLSYLPASVLPFLGYALGGPVGGELGIGLTGTMITSFETHKVIQDNEEVLKRKRG